MTAPADILLGDGVFAIGSIDIALTRGGGKFTVERDYKQIEADGDFGPVKGRIRKVKSVAKLVMNSLEILPANIPKMHPATKATTASSVTTITATEDIVAADYQDKVSWTGKTLGGDAVVIELENAINLENIDWALVDKDELVAALTYTATYLEATRKTEPWSVKFTKPSGG